MADSEYSAAGLVEQAVDAPIQFFDLKAQQAGIRPALEKRWKDILDHGRYIGGPEVTELEQKLCEFTGAADAVAVGSGTQALVMPMIGLGYGYGDAVFLPGFTYNASANAVLLAGATPVFVDIDPETFNICPADLERRVKQVAKQRNLRAKAVMPVDLYGLPADYEAIGAVADKYGLQIISDAAQSFGGKVGNKWVGALASITATSFYPTKTLGGYGDGGAILTTDKGIGDMLRSIRWHGTGDDRKDSIRVGLNGRCDSIQCAVVSEKLSIFEEERARRLTIDAIYRQRLSGVVTCQGKIADSTSGSTSACGLFTIRVSERDRVREELKAKGIPTSIYYDTPLHRMPAFEHFSPAGGLPECERASEEVLSLPMHPYLSEGQVAKICDGVLGAIRG
ncbi:MAG: DegT/DnrJ/EryC1/StrS family aminotransferase [Hyphomonadaceae bacterium]